MIHITDKTNCCGCEACVQVCPQQCITFVNDEEGFMYPKVDKTTCLDCGVCERTCPVQAPYESRRPQQLLAAINPDSFIRKQSSSGGIFTMLAERVLGEGGVVFGVRFDERWQAVFDYSETSEGLAAFRGSKYVQARVGHAFLDVRHFLNQNRKVLFSGTPCQVAALRHFLHHDYEKLFLVDFICHGVPSPKVWSRYLQELTHNSISAICDVQFRNKSQGWKRYNFDITYEREGMVYNRSSWHQQNHFMRIFLQDVILRPSCFDCKAKGGRSHSDLTLGDFWGIDYLNSDMDDDKGTSLVMIHTYKGASYFNSLKTKSWVAKYDEILPLNPAVERSAIMHPNRSQFFERFDSTNNVVSLIDETLRVSFLMQFKQKAKRLLYRVWHILSVLSSKHRANYH